MTRSLMELAEYVCIAAKQIDLELSTNEYGPGPKVYAKMDPFPEIAMDWRDPKFRDWLENKDLDTVIVLGPPGVSYVVCDEAENTLMVVMIRLHTPTNEDYEVYAKRCGCGSIDEAVDRYGDIAWSFDLASVLVKGTDIRAFLCFVAPYCWKDK